MLKYIEKRKCTCSINDYVSLRRYTRKKLITLGGGYNLEEFMGLLLGSLSLFYPLLIASVITFIYALIKRSCGWMLLSAILLYPDAWFFSGYPLFPWAKFIPFIQVILAIIFYLMKRNKAKT